MKVATLQFNPLQVNTYVIWDDTLECAIIDAGCYGQNEDQALADFIQQNGLTPKLAINTHGHFDHVMGVEAVRERYGIPFAMSKRDQFLLDTATPGSKVYGIELKAMPSTIDIDLDEVKEVSFGETTLQIIPTPGHTPGQVAIFEPNSRSLFTGDTLFRESIGRTDLPGGDYSWIMVSILEVLVPLGDDVEVYPGHAGSTTIGHEVLYNPFIVEVINQEVNAK